MNHTFKFNPILIAMLSLCSVSHVYATDHIKDTKDEADYHQSSIKEKQTEENTQHYDGQHFFEKYYQQNDTNQYIDTTRHGQLNRFCQGVWVTPIAAHTYAADLEDSTSIVNADYGYYNPQGESELSGNVTIDQQGRQIRADHVMLDASMTQVTAQGQVEVAQNGLVSQSDVIHYNLKDQIGDLEHSYYISEQLSAHGKANKIERPNPDMVILHDASYTSCAPSAIPTWKLQAKEIKLNQATGRGATHNTKLYIKNTPVLAIPYFNFPIDDRRMTGLLVPSIGYTNSGGVQIATPVYLNLAPNYDATITPRLMTDHGLMLEGEFRYLTEKYGHGSIWGGYLQDRHQNDEKRGDFHTLYEWNINPKFHLLGEYNYASDKDYFSDLSNNPNTYTDLNLRRALQLNYANGIQGLTGQLKVESFQTLDPDVSDENRPYARLPQLLLNYVRGYDVSGWQFEFNHDSAYFKKDLKNRDSSIANDGTRVYNKLALRYNYQKPYVFIIPEISVRNISTWYNQDDLSDADTKNHTSVTVPQFNLDLGLNFEKQGTYLQQISPRAFYAYAPYKNQSNHPNFDTASASVNYDQLFNSTRFYGHDRLDDNNFLSLGVHYRLFDAEGLERLRLGVGQSYFFEDRRVTLGDVETEKHTGSIMSLGSQLNKNLSVNANTAWTSSGSNAQRDIQFYYTDDKGSLYNLGYFYRQNIAGRQLAYNQVMASLIHPIKDNWRIMAHAQYDIDHDVMRDMLVGINYESCCWGVSVYGRSYYNDLDNPKVSDVNSRQAIMAEFTLKGLGGLNNKLSRLLESRILGFNKTNQTWIQR